MSDMDERLRIIEDGLATSREWRRHWEARSDEWVTKAEFTPIRLIVYGLVASILVTVLAAILRLVVLGR